MGRDRGRAHKTATSVSASYLFVPAIQRLRQVHERQKLAAVTEGILTACTLGELCRLVVTEVAGIFAAAQQLAEARNRRAEAEVVRGAAEVVPDIGGLKRLLDEQALVGVRQLVA